MQSRKIFFVADAKSIHTVKWVNYFVENKYDVYLATFANINNTKCKKVYFLSKKKSNTRGGNYHYFFSILKLSKIFKNIQPDIINAHYSYSMGFIALIAKNISQISSNFSVVCHGSDLLTPPKPYVVNKLNRYILKKSDKIFVVSDQLKDKIDSLKIDRDQVFVGQYGIDFPVLNNINKDIDILSNRIYKANSRIDFLLDAIDHLNYKNLNIVFVIPDIKDKDYHILKSKYPYITFYKYIQYSEMINLMSRTKIYISATNSDGTSLSLLEAMALNCILVVSNIASNRSWILDGINGYLFNNKKELLVKLERALNLKQPKSMIDINKKLINDKAIYKTQMKKIEKFLMQR